MIKKPYKVIGKDHVNYSRKVWAEYDRYNPAYIHAVRLSNQIENLEFIVLNIESGKVWNDF